jgi:GDP-D-mannose dehydratase
LLLSKGYKVVGMVRRSSTLTFERIQHLQDDIEIVQGDLHDQSSLMDLSSSISQMKSTTWPPNLSSPPPGTSRC